MSVKVNGHTDANMSQEEDIFVEDQENICDPLESEDMPTRSNSEYTGEEFRRDVLASHAAIQTSIDQLCVAMSKKDSNSNSWKSPSGVGVLITIIVLLVSGIVEAVRLEDKVASQDQVASAITKLNETVIRWDQRQQDEDVAHRVAILEKAQFYAAGENEQKRKQESK